MAPAVLKPQYAAASLVVSSERPMVGWAGAALVGFAAAQGAGVGTLCPGTSMTTPSSPSRGALARRVSMPEGADWAS